MTFERTPGSGPEPVPNPPPADDGASTVPASTSGPTPLQVRLQILTTEHWSLLASRGLAWNESFARASMYLSTLSGALVALGLIGSVDGFHDAFYVAALVVLPVVLFVGFGTWVRMGATNYHDAVTVAGMNRIRAAYLEIAPDLEPYFVMGIHDDAPGIGITMAVPPGTSPFAHLIAGTPTLVMVLNGVVLGAIVSIVALRFTALDPALVVGAGLVGALLTIAAEFRSAQGKIRRGQRTVQPMFPTPAPGSDRP
ncbi:MAG TPA: hypothetical protein VH440_10620 [Candidatus Limnocylindrales bacterium]